MPVSPIAGSVSSAGRVLCPSPPAPASADAAPSHPPEHDIAVGHEPVEIVAVLNAEWAEVTSQWITRAAISLRDDGSVPGSRPIKRWQACLDKAKEDLPADLAELTASDTLSARFGLNARLPVSFRMALLRASAEEALQDTEQGRVTAPAALLALQHIGTCLEGSARDVITIPLMQPLFDALHRGTSFGSRVERVENAPAPGPFPASPQ